MKIKILAILSIVLFGCSQKKPIKNPIVFNTTEKFLAIKNPYIHSNFSYEFWVKLVTDDTLIFTTENNSNDKNSGKRAQLFVVFPEPGYSSVKGSGVSVARNGIAVFERGSNYFGARINYKKELEMGWHHIAVVYLNDVPHLYHNGLFIRKGSYAKHSAGTYFSIGRKLFDNKKFIGELDEFRVWNYPLNENDINERMNHELTGFEKGLKVYYNFNNTDGSTIIYDNSGNQQHAYPVFNEKVFGIEIRK